MSLAQDVISKFEYEKHFQNRCDTLLLNLARDFERPSFPNIIARLKTGIDPDKAVEGFISLIEDPKGSIFYSYQLIGTYLYFRDIWTKEITEKVKDVFRKTPIYRGDTENHILMYYTSIYLAAQTFPDIEVWFNGKTTEENMNEAKGFLNYWYNITFSEGQGEFDSPVYITLYINTMLMMTDFAKERDMQIKSRMALDLVLVDMAVEYLKGIYGGGHSRIYQRTIFNDSYDDFSVFAYLYFGNIDKRIKSYGAYAAVSSYRLPRIIYYIATDRSTPYVHKEKKRVRNIIRFSDVLNPPVYKYIYMTGDYVLGSLQGGILQPIQQHTWDLSFITDEEYNTVFSLHPYYSSRELAMFFPERQKIMIDDVVRSKSTYDKEDKWTGSSPYERTFQHKNTIIVLYNIATDVNVKHIDAYFPITLKKLERTESRWIIGEAGNIYFAYYPLKSYEWIKEEEGYRLRSPNKRNGLVFEVRFKSDFTSYEEFKSLIISNEPDYANFDETLAVSYVNTEGVELRFTFPDKRYLNGELVDLTEYKLFEGPFIFANRGTQKIEIRYKNIRRVLNLKELKIENYVVTNRD